MSDGKWCGTCRHWLGDSWDERGACGIDASYWASTLRTSRGYAPGVAETVRWALNHIKDWSLPACGRWREEK